MKKKHQVFNLTFGPYQDVGTIDDKNQFFDLERKTGRFFTNNAIQRWKKKNKKI